MDSNDKLQSFILLEKERKQLEDRIKEIRAETAQLQVEILDDFSRLGIQKVTLDGLTAYVQRDIDVVIQNKEAVVNEIIENFNSKKEESLYQFLDIVPDLSDVAKKCKIVDILIEHQKQTNECLIDWNIDTKGIAQLLRDATFDGIGTGNKAVEVIQKLSDEGAITTNISFALRTRRLNNKNSKGELENGKAS